MNLIYLYSNPFFLVFIFGFISGIISSVPLGPTNLWLVNSVLPPKKSALEQVYFIVAIIFMDILYALLALWGYYGLLQGTNLSFLIIFISAVTIVCIGIVDLRKIFTARPEFLVRDSQNLSSFLLGVVMGCNPGFIVYWLMVAKTIESFGIPEINFYYGVAFSIGLLIADVFWYSLVIRLSKYCSNFMSGNILKLTRAFLACFMIFFGLIMLWEMRSIKESFF